MTDTGPFMRLKQPLSLLVQLVLMDPPRSARFPGPETLPQVRFVVGVAVWVQPDGERDHGRRDLQLIWAMWFSIGKLCIHAERHSYCVKPKVNSNRFGMSVSTA